MSSGGGSDYGAGQGSAAIFGGMFDLYNTREAQNREYDNAKKLQQRQLEQMQEMFPLISFLSNQGTDLFRNNWGDIEDFLTKPIPMTGLEHGVPEYFEGEGRAQMEEATGRVRGLWPYMDELVDTGFLTDIQPYQDYATRLLEREMVPDLAERFGSNITGSGFQNALFGASGDVASELGAMKVGLQEAATGRRMEGMAAAPGLYEEPSKYQSAWEQLAGNVGEQYRLRQESVRPGGRLMGAMPTFANIASSQNFLQPGFPQYGSDFANMLSGAGMSGLGAGLGQGISALVDWYQSQPTTGQNQAGNVNWTNYDPGFTIQGTGVQDTSSVNRIFEKGSIYA